MQQIVRHLDRVDSARPDKFVNSGVIVLGCEPDEPHKPLVAQSPNSASNAPSLRIDEVISSLYHHP